MLGIGDLVEGRPNGVERRLFTVIRKMRTNYELKDELNGQHWSGHPSLIKLVKKADDRPPVTEWE